MEKIISSQHYLNDNIIDEKRAAKDYGAVVTKAYTLDGITFRVVLDGHHSIAAARLDGVNADVTEIDGQRAMELDYIVETRGVEGLLEELHMGEGDYFDVSDKTLVW
ncbi:hypothetical protein [Oceanibaculum nanhaiense]|uniref:hypothetical protein n=1 Tax=Oceanibaculum nanhaiense TaxID=1909734 RepID=UPI003D2E8806